MKKNQFNYHLPDDLIAQYPLENRSDSRLLVYSKSAGEHSHQMFRDLSDYLNPGDLLVMNDSKVIPARFYGKKTTGGRVEILVERILDQQEFFAHIKSSKSPKNGSVINLENGWYLTIIEKNGDLYHCQASTDISTILNAIGHMPLPPYINRNDESLDLSRYQTVYANSNAEGSVAAPTAGLHFDNLVLDKIKEKGVNIAYTTLHVGASTFQPVRSEDINDHKMHTERLSISQQLCDLVTQTKQNGGRVIAVGTTALRSLESGVVNGQLQPCVKDTSIFITPGYTFKVCDGLITNFHLPESTLLMLVSAFIGHEQAMKLYDVAINNGYRFFSYGDASLFI
ncbi:MAG: tRNA preQ1(34) S-adenosylmethionine ribosyltransferase-isomerase QueA [Legionellaceae bacterium]|nr:tRNA preQ1(34) S-adenosylmethionine ribosyltransferase-isomerase QueA [Legionellaceae bacterium]